jgi:phosphoribosylanthranilate isomerase
VRLHPYVGFTGVTTREQAMALRELHRWHPLPGRVLMVGALSSHKALMFGAPSDPERYLLPVELDKVFLDGSGLLNLVHYNAQAAGLADQVALVVKRPTHCHGVQLNVPWPRPDQLRRMRQEVFTQIVLQLSRQAWLMIREDSELLVSRLRHWYVADLGGGPKPLFDRLLIDFSGGRGVELNVEVAAKILTALIEAELPFQYGLAGGLNPDNLECLAPLLARSPDLSWDMESGVRTDGQLDLEKCEAAWEASRELLVEAGAGSA